MSQEANQRRHEAAMQIEKQARADVEYATVNHVNSHRQALKHLARREGRRGPWGFSRTPTVAR